MSLGNLARSTSRILWLWRASNIAVDAPAQRAPTTMASYPPSIAALISCARRNCQPVWLAVSRHLRLPPAAVSRSGQRLTRTIAQLQQGYDADCGRRDHIEG